MPLCREIEFPFLLSGGRSMLPWLSLPVSSALCTTYVGVSIFNVRGLHFLLGDPWSPFLGCWKLCVWEQGWSIVGLCCTVIQRVLGTFSGRPPNVSVCGLFFSLVGYFLQGGILNSVLHVGWGRVNGEGYELGCPGSQAKIRGWGISSVRMECFSHPSAPSSMPNPTFYCAWCP